jgi:hypothetical protein
MFRKVAIVALTAALFVSAQAAAPQEERELGLKMTTNQKNARKVKHFDLCVGTDIVNDEIWDDDDDIALTIAAVEILYECDVSVTVHVYSIDSCISSSLLPRRSDVTNINITHKSHHKRL